MLPAGLEKAVDYLRKSPTLLVFLLIGIGLSYWNLLVGFLVILFGVVINAYFLALSELRRDVESAHQSLAAVEGEFTALSTQASGLREKLEHSEKQFDVFKNRFFADFEGFLSFDTTEERLKRLEDIVLGQEEEKPLKSESIDRRLERIEWLLQKHFNDF